MRKQYLSMNNNIKILGALLSDTIKDTVGKEIVDLVETISQLSKKAQQGDNTARGKLFNIIENLSNNQLIPIARAFNQFLNLVNIAVEYYGISPHGEAENSLKTLATLFNQLKNKKIDPAKIKKAISELSIELVLTAHPTETNRRTLIHTYNLINHCLSQLDHNDLADYEKDRIMRRLRQLVCQTWHTDEIRKQRPTPLDEAKWGFSVIENSLWEGVPLFLRELNNQIDNAFGLSLPIEATPIKFSSWIGGDRDGNPNVTAEVTSSVMLQAQLKASTLFLHDIQILIKELSMSQCNQEVLDLIEDKNSNEPYRVLLRTLRQKLINTHGYLNAVINKEHVGYPIDLILHNKQLWIPLYACYNSLVDCGMSIIANGPLLDTLRRVQCFGLQLLSLDIRQESQVHTEVLKAITKELGLGNYQTWSEQQKQHFLLQALQSKNTLLPLKWHPDKRVKEVVDTCQVIASASEDAISAYVISMAKAPSDILAVYLLLKIVNCKKKIPIVPLFETLDDLNNANNVIKALFEIPWYREKINNYQMVMIGYSDSAKDAGSVAAAWAQYRTQEVLIKTCEDANIHLTLFHGRGGSIGRGGAPAHAALLSQPPGSLKTGLRVTEQGEMMRFKLGLPEIALSNLLLYTSAILEANLLPPPEPKQCWRDLMDELSQISCHHYRHYVINNPSFIKYFHHSTPEAELARLPLGSRPAKRHAGGIENLRAIPWVFAWTQNRLMLPSWLGAGYALAKIIHQKQEKILKTMYADWPFFNTRLGMLEMVYAKADPHINHEYEKHLVDHSLWDLGASLREELTNDINIVLQITNDKHLMADLPWIAESVALRNTYIEPLNLLQIELLKRIRKHKTHTCEVEQALMITISGIAAGMRNSG